MVTGMIDLFIPIQAKQDNDPSILSVSGVNDPIIRGWDWTKSMTVMPINFGTEH